MIPSEDTRRLIDFRSVWAVVKKEFLDNVRNKWIIAISVIFIILALVVSYFGAAQAGGGAGFQGLSDTVTGMAGIEVFIVPILGLMLSYAAVVGEKEKGSILLLLSMPITRLETILGKFLGLASVMMAAIISGLGISGAVIMVTAGTEGWENYLLFILGSMVFALAFLSVGLLLSTITKRRSTAMGLAVFLWFFFAMIFDLVLIGVYVATGGSLSFQPGQQPMLPNWYYAVASTNPVDAFQFFTFRAFGITQSFGAPFDLPSFVTLSTAALSIL
ncbi:MAG: ABC transporter permease, partial [Candidatus Thermoplasmatota archaeon]|nr:ABC transporter permease [Candidatus Thermoplasmatota archaeon]